MNGDRVAVILDINGGNNKTNEGDNNKTNEGESDTAAVPPVYWIDGNILKPVWIQNYYFSTNLGVNMLIEVVSYLLYLLLVDASLFLFVFFTFT